MRGSGTPIWEDLATADDLAALSPPRPDGLPESPDVLVVGGGVIGLAIAASCTQVGMDVLLVEREERLASGPSGRAAGGLGPDVHPELGPRWHEHAKRSLELHVEIDNRWDTGLRRQDIRLPPDSVVANQGHVYPLRLCAVLAQHAGTIAIATDVRDIDVRASNVVYATGDAPGPAGVADQAFVKGHLIATEPVPPLFDGVAGELTEGLLFAQLPSGHVIGGGTKEPDVDGADVDERVVEHIVRTMHRVVPETEGLHVSHRWTCFRPHVPGYLPVVRRISSNSWCAAGFYSTGILMAPVVGDLIASAIANRESPDDLFA